MRLLPSVRARGGQDSRNVPADQYYVEPKYLIFIQAFLSAVTSGGRTHGSAPTLLLFQAVVRACVVSLPVSDVP